MDLLKDVVHTIIAFLTKHDSVRKTILTNKKVLALNPGVVRFIIALAQCRLGNRAYYKRIQRGSVKGTWWGKDARSSSEEVIASGDGPIVLYIHGGAFISGQSKMWSDFNVDIINQHKKKYNKDLRIFCVDYTLAPDKSFPHQWNECQAAVDYLLRSLRVNPARLFLSGDSAGGNLCLQTLFEMENAKSLAGAICFSPWAYPGATLAMSNKVKDTANVAPKPHNSWFVNAENDYITDNFGTQGVIAYVGQSMTYETAYQSPQINPTLRKPQEFAALPDLLITIGGGEVLKDQIAQFIDKAKEHTGDVEVLSSENGVHDWPLNSRLNPERATYDHALETISAWVEKKMIHA